MIIPVRCFSCGRVVASAWEDFARRTRAGEDPEAVLDSLGLERYCCRRMLIANIDLPF
jgi:DNA-directed RNA polymerase subunit N